MNRFWKIHTDPYPHLRENGDTILARDVMPSSAQVALIEAAPELYEALERILRPSPDPAEWYAADVKARAALAKATGGQP